MIFNLMDIHPMTADQLVRIGLFPTQKVCLRRMLRLVRKKKIKMCGTALLNDYGRPVNVYARWQPKYDNLRHEVMLTEFLLPFRKAQIIRGYETSREYRPDAEMKSNGHTYFVEFDCGTMGYKDIHERFKKYEKYEGIVLWVALTDVRKEGLRNRAEKVKHNALFTTLSASLLNPFGGVWLDFEGQITHVEQPVDKREEDSRA